MLIVYTRNEDGTLERTNQGAISRKSYLEEMSRGIPAEFAPKPTGTEDLMGWPESKVEWYGTFGFGVK